MDREVWTQVIVVGAGNAALSAAVAARERGSRCRRSREGTTPTPRWKQRADCAHAVSL